MSRFSSVGTPFSGVSKRCPNRTPKPCWGESIKTRLTPHDPVLGQLFSRFIIFCFIESQADSEEEPEEEPEDEKDEELDMQMVV